MKSLLKTSWVETKLFLREPVTVLFTFALPLMVLYVLGGVFGNEADTGENGGFLVYGGYGPTNWYTAAYVGMAIAGVALIGVPAHIAEYRERGVLRRLRASSVPRLVFLSSQLIVAFLISTIGSVLLLAVAFPTTSVAAPESVGLFLLAFVLGTICFSAFGISARDRVAHRPGGSVGRFAPVVPLHVRLGLRSASRGVARIAGDDRRLCATHAGRQDAARALVERRVGRGSIGSGAGNRGRVGRRRLLPVQVGMTWRSYQLPARTS